ncbi:MAG: competence protein ComK [Heyndrickxia sp.]
MIELKDYLVNHTTVALTEIYHPEFNTKIYELGGIYYSKQTMKEILRKSCEHYCSTYEGRIKVVRNALSYWRRTPLMVCQFELIYAFPTKSPDDFSCRWIFPAHIHTHIIENNHLYVKFKNGMKVELNCSLNTYLKQKERTAHCLSHFSVSGPVHYHRHFKTDKNRPRFDRWNK